MKSGMRDLRTLALLAVACTMGTSVALGGPGSGIEVGKLLLRPYADASATYDSNPSLVNDNESDDVFLEGELGLGFSYKLGSLDLSGTLFGFYRDYLQEDAATSTPDSGMASDSEGFGESLGLALGNRDLLRVTLSESFQRVQDYSRQPYTDARQNTVRQESFVAEDRADRVERDAMNLSAGAGRDLTDKIELDGTLSYNEVDYKSAGLFDTSEVGGSASSGYRVTDKSTLFVMGRYSIQDTDAFATSDPESKIVRGGWRTRFTEKSMFDGSVGMEYYDDGTTDTPGRDSTQAMPSYDVAWLWLPFPKLSFQLSGGNSIEPSSYEALNTREVRSLGGAVGYHPVSAILLSAGLSARQDDYRYADTSADAAGVSIRRKTDAYGAKLGASYAPVGKWYSLYSTLSYESNDSTLEIDEFDQLRFSVGARATY